MKENRFATILKNKLEGPARVFNIHGHAMQERGWPDFQIYSRIFTGHVELKVNTRKVTPLQKKRIADLKMRHTKAGVLRLLTDNMWVNIEDEDGVTLGGFPLQMSGVPILNLLNLTLELDVKQER